MSEADLRHVADYLAFLRIHDHCTGDSISPMSNQNGTLHRFDSQSTGQVLPRTEEDLPCTFVRWSHFLFPGTAFGMSVLNHVRARLW